MGNAFLEVETRMEGREITFKAVRSVMNRVNNDLAVDVEIDNDLVLVVLHGLQENRAIETGKRN